MCPAHRTRYALQWWVTVCSPQAGCICSIPSVECHSLPVSSVTLTAASEGHTLEENIPVHGYERLHTVYVALVQAFISLH